MNCDLCGKTISSSEIVRIPSRGMQQAVRDGFNPFQAPGIDMSASVAVASTFGMSVEQVFQHWRQKVTTDTTDWGLCSACAAVFRRSSKRAPAPKAKPLTGERDYGALFGSWLSSVGRTPRALKKFEKQVSSDPDTADKFFWLGAACMVSASAEKDPTHLDRAIGLFEKALEIYPSYKNAYSKLLGAYISKEDYPAVRRTALRWAKVDPDLPPEARQWLREQEAMAAVTGIVQEPAKAKVPEAKVICAKCQARNSTAQEVCLRCGASLLPGRSIGDRVKRLVLTILVSGFFAALAVLLSELGQEELYCWYSFVLMQSLFSFVGGLAWAFGRTPEYEKHIRRAQRHIAIEPEQALADFTQALKLAPEKERTKISRQRTQICEKLGREPVEELMEFAEKPPMPAPPPEAVAAEPLKARSRLRRGFSWVANFLAGFFCLFLVLAAALTAMDHAKGIMDQRVTGGIIASAISLFMATVMALLSVVMAERKKRTLAIWGVLITVAVITGAIIARPLLEAKFPKALSVISPAETLAPPTRLAGVPTAPTPVLAPTFVTFRDNIFSFEYLSDWEVITDKEIDVLLKTSLEGLKPGNYDYIGGVYKGGVDNCQGCATIVVVVVKNPSLTGTLSDQEYERVKAAAEQQMGSRLISHRKTEVSSMPAAESVHTGKSRLTKLWELIIVPPEPGVAYLFNCSSHKDSYPSFEEAFKRAIESLRIGEFTPPVATPTLESGVTTYTVQAGDTLAKIAKEFEVTVEAIIEANEIEDPDLIQVGQVLAVPPAKP